jgi:hypothetical protein
MDHKELLAEGWVLAGHIGVDSGQVMVCDPCYVLPDVNEEGENLREGWKPEFPYGKACGWDEVPDEERKSVRPISFKMGHEGAAVVCDSGYGDGYYPVYVKFEDKGPWGVRVVAMMVDFDTDDPSEAYDG